MYAVGTNIALLQIDLLYEETRQQYWKKKKAHLCLLFGTTMYKSKPTLGDLTATFLLVFKITSLLLDG